MIWRNMMIADLTHIIEVQLKDNDFNNAFANIGALQLHAKGVRSCCEDIHQIHHLTKIYGIRFTIPEQEYLSI